MAEQWIKEAKYALNCPDPSGLPQVRGKPGEAMAVRPFGNLRTGLAYASSEGGNFMRRLVLPEDMNHWTQTSLQTRLIKTRGPLVRHAGRLVFQFRLRPDASG